MNTPRKPDTKQTETVTVAPCGFAGWRVVAIAIVLLVFSAGCNADARLSEVDNSSSNPNAPPATVSSEPVATALTPGVERPPSSPTAPSDPLPSLDPEPEGPTVLPTLPPTEQPTAVATSPPTVQPPADEEVLSNRGEVQAGSENRIFFMVPALGDFYLAAGQPQGEPFGRQGPMPEAVVASTEDCQLITIDSDTGDFGHVWDYPNFNLFEYYNDDRSSIPDKADEEVSPTVEALCDSIEVLEWASPSFILISTCCEPAIGTLEIIDTSLSNQPSGFGIAGDSPSVNDQEILSFSIPHGFRTAVDVIGTIPFDPQFDWSEVGSGYDREADYTLYALDLISNNSPNVGGFVYDISWVGDDKMAFELWTTGLYPGLYPFIGLIDITSQTITFKSRGEGWTRPTGDAQGNLVVAEQRCTQTPETCDTGEAKIVVLDSDALTPIYEIPVNENVIDMDLARGWLLVTYANGQTGTLDLADGTFKPIADSIVNAGWME